MNNEIQYLEFNIEMPPGGELYAITHFRYTKVTLTFPLAFPWPGRGQPCLTFTLEKGVSSEKKRFGFVDIHFMN